MSGFMRAVAIWGVLVLAFIFMVMLGGIENKQKDHDQNMECIKAGGTYAPVSQMDSRMVCNK